jgi:uncharacterized membrane protein
MLLFIEQFVTALLEDDVTTIPAPLELEFVFVIVLLDDESIFMPLSKLFMLQLLMVLLFAPVK